MILWTECIGFLKEDYNDKIYGQVNTDGNDSRNTEGAN